MEPEIVAASIQAGATVATGVLAALAVIAQIGKQARHGIEQNRESERLKLKVEIYKQIISVCAAQENASLEFSSKIRSLLWQMSRVTSHESLAPARTASFSWSELNALNGEAQRRSISVVTLVEQWRIVEPRLDLFQLAVNVALQDVRSAWPWFSIAAQVLPPHHVDEDGTWRPPEDAVAFLAKEADAVLRSLMKLDAWVADFQAELQSQLLADLFKNEVPVREPIDHSLFAIRLDRYEEVKARLLDSDWGRQSVEADERARKTILTDKADSTN